MNLNKINLDKTNLEKTNLNKISLNQTSLEKELRIPSFNQLLKEYQQQATRELEEVEKKRSALITRIELINHTIASTYEEIMTKNLEHIRAYGQHFENELYDKIADRYSIEDNRLDEYVYRLQNIYSTEKLLRKIPLQADMKALLIENFPVIKIWTDSTSSQNCEQFVVEYYKHHFNISTRLDTFFFDLNYERVEKQDFNRKREKWNIVQLFQNFDYTKLNELQSYLEILMFEKNIPDDLFLGLLIMAYFYLFEYKNKYGLTTVTEFLKMLEEI